MASCARLFQPQHGRLARLLLPVQLVCKAHLGNQYLQRPALDMAAEMLHLKRHYRPDHIWFADDIFGFKVDWVKEFGAALAAAGGGVPFTIQLRADLVSPRMATALYDAGCKEVWIGAESGSQKILDGMERGVTVEQVQRSTKLAQAHGIQVGMFLMWGYEGEQLEDIAATVEHVKRSNPDVFLTTVAYPIKGTGYFAKVRDKIDLPLPWTLASDRDHLVAGRRSKEYYKLADVWLRSAVEASRIEVRDPARAAELLRAAQRAQASMRDWGRPPP